MLSSLVRAIVELGLARVRLRSRDLRPMVASDAAAVALDCRQQRLVDHLAYVIPRVAARLPWKADCLVQAMAAEHWLKRAGIASTLHFGVPRDKAHRLEAHAWLTVGTRVVTGGDVAGYAPLSRGATNVSNPF